MNKIENLKELFVEQGRELYDAFRQEQKELPDIQKQVSSLQLKKVIERQVNTAKNQSLRMQEAFKKLNMNPEGEKSECCQSILNQTKKMIKSSKDPEVRDAVIINSVQRINHNKITGLGSLTAYAKAMGEQEIANSLHQTLNDEKSIDKDLSELAEREINKKALKAVAH